ALRGKRNLEGAIAELRTAVEIDPKHARARNGLGVALGEKVNFVAAVAEFRKAVERDPNYAEAHRNLATAWRVTGDLAGAVDSHRKVVELAPKDASAHNELAWLLSVGRDGVRNGKQAVEHATRACELTDWKNPGYIDTLASAYAEAGDF